MRSFLWIALAACLPLAACSSDNSPPFDIRDSGGTRDAGVTTTDAGSATDAGTPRDAGPTTTDSGTATDSGTPPDAGGSADAGSAPDGGSTTDAGPPVDAGPIDSGTSGSPCAFVTMLEMGCTTDTDCTFGVHQTDCCGNSRAVGFNVGESTRFGMLEPICAASYPLCGCPAGPTRTDSDEVVFDTSSVQTGCIASGPRNVCLTYVTMRPPGTP